MGKTREMELSKEKGQIIVEAILLALVSAIIMSLVVTGLQQGQFVQKLTIEPWEKLKGMIECGVWQPCGVSQPAAGMHPSTPPRRLSLDPSGESD